MRYHHLPPPARTAALTLVGSALLCLLLAGCSGDSASPAPLLGLRSQTPGAGGSPTPVAYAGTQVTLANADNGKAVAAPLGSDLVVTVGFPLADDCVPPHLCAVAAVDDPSGVLLRSQEMTTCGTDACSYRREAFLGRPGTATLTLQSVEQCPWYSGAACTPQPHTTLWSVHITVGS